MKNVFTYIVVLNYRYHGEHGLFHCFRSNCFTTKARPRLSRLKWFTYTNVICALSLINGILEHLADEFSPLMLTVLHHVLEHPQFKFLKIPDHNLFAAFILLCCLFLFFPLYISNSYAFMWVLTLRRRSLLRVRTHLTVLFSIKRADTYCTVGLNPIWLSLFETTYIHALHIRFPSR